MFPTVKPPRIENNDHRDSSRAVHQPLSLFQLNLTWMRRTDKIDTCPKHNCSSSVNGCGCLFHNNCHQLLKGIFCLQVLQCQHTFCEQCLVRWYDKGGGGSQGISCPTCRNRTPLPDANIASLPSDFKVQVWSTFLHLRLQRYSQVLFGKPIAWVVCSSVQSTVSANQFTTNWTRSESFPDVVLNQHRRNSCAAFPSRIYRRTLGLHKCYFDRADSWCAKWTWKPGPDLQTRYRLPLNLRVCLHFADQFLSAYQILIGRRKEPQRYTENSDSVTKSCSLFIAATLW